MKLKEPVVINTYDSAHLDQIVADVDDIAEPAHMEKITMCLEEMQIQDEMFMQLLLEKLQDVEITWEQPWYQKTKSLTRPLTIEVEGDDVEIYRTDAICQEECEQIERNWHDFVKEYCLPDTPISFARWKNKDKSRNPSTPEERVRHYVTAYLAQGLERNLYQVYRFVLTHYGGPVKGFYSDTEIKIMDICFHHCPGNAVTLLSSVLSREPRGLYKRLHQMYNGKIEKKKMKWTLPLATKLLKLLQQYMECSLEELKNEKIHTSVWLQLQQDMDHHYTCLQQFWYRYLHNQLYVKSKVKLKRLRKKIFEKLRLYPYRVWSDIRWKNILKQFPDGFTHYFLYRVCYSLVKTYPKYHKVSLDTLIDYCLEKNKSSKSIRLKTLSLNNDGNLEIVKYDDKMKTK